MKVRNVVLVCVALITVGLPKFAFGEMEYFALFMAGKKVGHAIQSRVEADGRVTTTEKVAITISRADIAVTTTTSETSIETTDGKPLGFEMEQDLSIMTMKITGTINEQGMVDMIIASMGTEQKKTIEWPKDAVMAEALRLLGLKKGLKEGLSYSVKVFSSQLLQAIEAQIEIGPKEKIDLLGRVVTLTKVTTTLKLPGAGEIVTTNYVDDELKTQKVIMSVAGMQIEMVSCAKEFALGQNDVLDIINKTFLPSPQPLDDVGSAKSISYYLSPTEPNNVLIIPSNDNQKVSKLKDNRLVVTVEPIALPSGTEFPYKGSDELILKALKPTRFLQSDNKQIIDLALRAVGNTKDAAEAVKRIESFVADYIDSRSLSVGYASAVEVAASKQGDCSEFSILAAAMCQAVGIPAQVVMGVAYVKEFGNLKNCFGGHAWVQAYVGDKWVCIDASFKNADLRGYDAGHIALAQGNGNPESFFSLLSTIGQFRIDKVIIR